MTLKYLNKIIFFIVIFNFNLILSKDEQPRWQEFKYTGSFRIIDYEGYILKIIRRTIEIFEEKHVSGGNLPILDQSIPINETMNGFNVEGNVLLYDGFVNKIKSVYDLKTNRNAISNSKEAYVKDTLYIEGVSVVYDSLLKFKDYDGNATMVFTFNKMTLNFKITQNLKTKAIQTEMELSSLNCKDFQTMAYPFDKYVQMGVRGIEKSGNAKFCDNFKKSIRTWKFYDCLQQAVNEIGFAELCFYC
uniref:CSON010672 protein n=1 Tax=Culicoides sonorensis TaxID=179676 RepID=A0A336LPM7_CULSO